MKVLIMVHDPDLSKSLLSNMKCRGYEAQVEPQAFLGVEAVADFAPDMVLVDFNLDSKHGTWALRKIRNLDPQLIVILLISSGLDEHARKGVELGATNYLSVPIQEGELDELLDRYEAILTENRKEDQIRELMICKSFTLEFHNQLTLVPKIAKHLMNEADFLLEDESKMMVELGLSELITNAVEHGNLAVTNAEKRAALERGRRDYYDLLDSRLAQIELASRKVQVSFTLNHEYAEWIIEDEGDGFDWSSIVDPTKGEAIMIAHGRGIFLSRAAFDELTYLERGNKVRIRKYALSSTPTPD